MNLRPDHDVIAKMLPQGARVLDIGCGDGELLQVLRAQNINARGMEIDQEKVAHCLQQGLSVMQGDANFDLAHYPEQGFDYAILTQVLQVTKFPNKILQEVLRISGKAIVSIPNFGHWENRLQLLVGGRMPVTKKLSYQWYETPNIHFCTIRDFIVLCHDLGIKIEQQIAVKPNGKNFVFKNSATYANLACELGIFLLSKK